MEDFRSPAHSFVMTVQIAKRQGVVNPENTFFSVKRFVGRKANEVKSEQNQMPYIITQDAAGNVKIDSKHAGKQFAPEEISALVLRKLVDDASKFLNDKVLSPFPFLYCEGLVFRLQADCWQQHVL